MLDNSKFENICKEAVYEQIYKKHVRSLRNFLFYRFGNLENAEDITQNAFIKLWENCEKIKPSKAKSFLFTTAVNLSLNTIKHQKVVLKYNARPHKTISNETPEYQMIEDEFYTKIQKTIASLSEKQREAFLLSRIEKMKYKEIALLLNISLKAVEKRIHAALLVMRKEIGNV